MSCDALLVEACDLRARNEEAGTFPGVNGLLCTSPPNPVHRGEFDLTKEVFFMTPLVGPTRSLDDVRPLVAALRVHLAATACSLLALVLAPAAVAGDEAPRDPGALEFTIENVGKGAFDNAILAQRPGEGDRSQPCVTLEGGSRSNTPELLNWVSSNSAGAALATRPAATLTVPKGREGLAEGTYHLTGITVSKFTKKADRDLTHPRLAGAVVNCESMTGPAS